MKAQWVAPPPPPQELQISMTRQEAEQFLQLIAWSVSVFTKGSSNSNISLALQTALNEGLRR